MRLGCPHCRNVFEVAATAPTAQCPACGFVAAMPAPRPVTPPAPAWGAPPPPPAPAAEWLTVEQTLPVAPPAPSSLAAEPRPARSVAPVVLLAVAGVVAVVALAAAGWWFFLRDEAPNPTVTEAREIRGFLNQENETLLDHVDWAANLDILVLVYFNWTADVPLPGPDYPLSVPPDTALRRVASDGADLAAELSALEAPERALSFQSARIALVSFSVGIAEDWLDYVDSQDPAAAQAALADWETHWCAKAERLIDAAEELASWFEDEGFDADAEAMAKAKQDFRNGYTGSGCPL